MPSLQWDGCARMSRFIKVGRVTVDTQNKLAMGIVQAGAKAVDVFHSSRSSDERTTVFKAEMKRQRKAATRLRNLK